MWQEVGNMTDVGKKWVIWLIRQEVGNMTDVARGKECGKNVGNMTDVARSG